MLMFNRHAINFEKYSIRRHAMNFEKYSIRF